MNLLTDSLPAIAIGMEPPEDGLIVICTMAAFHMGLNQGDEMLASTMAFATLTLARLFHGFNCRSDIHIFKLGFKVSALKIGQLGAILILALIPTIIIQYGKLKNNDK